MTGLLETAALGPTMGSARSSLARALDALARVDAPRAEVQAVRATVATALDMVERLDQGAAADGLAGIVSTLRACVSGLATRSGDDPIRAAAAPLVAQALAALEQVERFLSQVIDPSDRSTLMLSPEDAAAPAIAHEELREAIAFASGGGAVSMDAYPPHAAAPLESAFGDSFALDVEVVETDGSAPAPGPTPVPAPSGDEEGAGTEELRLDFTDDGIRILGLDSSIDGRPTARRGVAAARDAGPAAAPEPRAPSPRREVPAARGSSPDRAPRPSPSRPGSEPRGSSPSAIRERPSPVQPMRAPAASPAPSPPRGFPGLTRPLDPPDPDAGSRPTRAFDYDAVTTPGESIVSRLARSPEASGDPFAISVVVTTDEPAPSAEQEGEDVFAVTREVDSRVLAVPDLDEPTGRATALADTMARDALRELSHLREQRRPRVGEHWRSREAAEIRLAERIDLVAALGPIVLADFERTLAGWDPGTAFALAVGLGCTDDSDAVARAAHMLARDPAEDPAVAAAIEEGLLLASSPLVRESMASLLDHQDARVVASAARVLLARDELLIEEARSLLARREPELIALGVRGFDGERDSDALNTLRALLSHEDDGVLDAVLASLAMAGDTLWLERARQLCAQGRGDVGRASMWLAIAGSSDELDPLVTAAATSATPIELDSLGVFGHPAAIPFLLGLLEAQEDRVSGAAAVALERITGAGLLEAESVEVVLPSDVPRVSLDADVPMRATLDAERWRTWWLSRRGDFDPGVRWRYGRPFTPGICVEELAERNCSPPDRMRAHYELRIASGMRVPFDTGWLLERQQGVFEQWRGWWARVERRWHSGRWPGAPGRGSIRPPSM